MAHDQHDEHADDDPEAAVDDSSDGSTPKRRRRRNVRPFPASSFKEAAELAEAMIEIAGGAREVRRITLFDHLKRSPESGPSRQSVTNSARYGLTEGSYAADVLTLTEDGLLAVNPEVSPRERARAQFRLAVEGIPAFRALYERFSNNKLPAQQVMRDFLVSEQQLSEDDAKEAVEVFIVNARDVGLLRTLSGAERILSLDHMLDLLPTADPPIHGPPTANGTGPQSAMPPATAPPVPVVDLGTTCFYITPIGDEGSEQRKHADLILGQIVEPAIEALGLDLVVVRADRLTQPGMISQQILQHVLGARLVVADLSFHNPNVFYELAIRHATGLPTVLISRAAERVPFDIADLRVVRLDMTDLYTFVPQIEAWRAELTQHARQALEQPEAAVTPITLLGGPLVGLEQQ
ncbi:MAG: hypothetical protein QOE65_2873 [Solirubrobacteraceae bacterium]|jgi:hypothetical protein|nr:hypothetical protein [Solirubrobacteraceae bacterium]